MRLLLLFVTLVFATTTQGQIQSGMRILGGGINLASNNSSNENFESKFTSASISPLYGHFITDQLAIGMSLGFGLSNSEYTSQTLQSDQKTKFVRISPLVRYYVSNNFFLSIRGGYNWQTQDVESVQSGFENPPTTITNENVIFEPGIGYDYFISDYMAIEGLLSYEVNNNQSNFNNGQTKTSSNNLSFSVGIQAFLR